MQTLKDIMTRDCITMSKQETIFDAACKMRDHNIGIVPVVEGKRLLGVVTDRDIVVRGLAERLTGSEPVERVMSENVQCASPDMTVEDAAKLMAAEQIRRLPIVENGELVGIVAIGDLAVRHDTEDEAGEALSRISEPARPM